MPSRLPTPGSDNGSWGIILNDFLSQSLNTDGKLLPVALTTAGGEVTSNKNIAGGYAGLDVSSKVLIANLPTGTTGSTVALGNMVGTSRSIIALIGTTTGATLGNTDYVYYWTGSITYPFTMPTAIGNTNLYTLKNTSTVNQTIIFTGGQNADGSTNLVLTPDTSLDLISNNTNYMIV